MTGLPVPIVCSSGASKEADSPQLENLYNSRVLVQNWYEDRRQYHQDCPRCTGYSIYKGDYLPHQAEDYRVDKCIPPANYATKAKIAGVGPRMMLNDYDYCEYMQNYMTTYDLVHNWEVRRAGCKPKPLRKWKLIMDAVWQPQPDNAVPFGNLTTIGFRQAAQLPMMPNDWHTYRTDTSYRRHFPPRSYPNDYVLCRYASSKANNRSTADMMLVPKEGICDNCRFKVRCVPAECCCSCHVGSNTPRFPTLVPQHTMKSYLPRQNLSAAGMKGNPVMKRDPHPRPRPGYPIYDSLCPDPCDNKEYCECVEENQRYRMGPTLRIDQHVCNS